MTTTLKTYFCVLQIVCIGFLFTTCSDDEEVINPYLKTDLAGETINFDLKAVDSYKVTIKTNQSDWKITPADTYSWCSYEIIQEKENFIIQFSLTENEGIHMREAQYTITASGCKPLKIRVVQMGTEHAILFNCSTPYEVSKDGEEFMLTVTSNVANEPIVEESAKGWIEITEQPVKTRAYVDKIYKIAVKKNMELRKRTGKISFTPTEETTLETPVKFTISQEEASAESMGDIKLKVKSAELLEGNVYGTQTVDYTIDGDYTTTYSSKQLEGSQETWKGKYILIEYTLETPGNIDYVRLVQRPDQNVNSLFASGSISIQREEQNTWEKEIPFETKQVAKANVDIPIGVSSVNKIRVRIDRMTPGVNNPNVALAEFECYQYSDDTNAIIEAQKFFTDGTYSELKPDVTDEDIKNIRNAIIYNLAKELKAGTYDKRFRFQTYHSCKSPIVAANELNIGNRSKFDNPTGIFFKKGEPIIVFVVPQGKNNVPISLAIADYRLKSNSVSEKMSNITLKEGLNTITPANDGNGYIQYWTDDDTPDVDVDIHFCFGTEIGYWDMRRGNTNADWPEILKIAQKSAVNIPNAMMDVLGEIVQLQNTVEAFARCVPTEIEKSVAMHDRMLYFEYAIMGLKKYDVIPSNRFFGVRTWGGNPNWNGTAANYPNSEDAMLIPEKFYSKNNVWVFGHEFGHGNQLQKMKGNGWTEVTNNLYAAYAQYMMRNDHSSAGYLRLEHEAFKGEGSTAKLAGGRINAHLYSAYVKHDSYFGSAKGGTDDKADVWQKDVFVKLVPLWQMALYFMEANVVSDFYPDLFWATIHGKKNNSPAEMYTNFMKRAIEASGMNLAIFFEEIGLLQEFNHQVDDYSVVTVNITKAMVDEIKQLSEGKPLPAAGMKYISANSIEAFKNKANVTGTAETGFTKGQGYITVDHNVWKNVVAFETYKGKQLVYVSIAGTADPTNKTTRVEYPTGATRIEAIGWDGTATLVTGNR